MVLTCFPRRKRLRQGNRRRIGIFRPNEAEDIQGPRELPIPFAKGWGHPIEMRLNLEALEGKHVMCLRSPGRDGKFSADSYTMGSFPAADFDQDVVWCDGYFIRWPK